MRGSLRHARWRIVCAIAVLTGVLTTTVTGLSVSTRAEAAGTSTAEPGKPVRAAATEQEAGRAARESMRRVEVLSLRDERSETYANPDGTFTVKEYVQPVRARKDGQWVALDTDLVRRADGRIAPAVTTTAISFSGGGNDRVLATMEKDGKRLSYSWPSPLPEPVLEGNAATYGSVLPDVDLVVRADADGFSHVLVVKSADAAADPRLETVELPVSADGGLTLSTGEDGGVRATDTAGGGTVFAAPQPVMWDSSGRGGRQVGPSAAQPAPGDAVADVGLSVRDGVMRLRPDLELLRGQDTEFPVYIDPVHKTYSRTGWTWVSSHNSTLEGWKFPNESDGIESGRGVGRCPADVSVRCAGADDVQRQYYAIPTGGLEGKTIVKAEFAITLVHAYNSDPRAVQLHRMNSSGGSAINSKTNWTNKPSSKDHIASESPVNTTGSCTQTNQNVRFPVTGTVQKAANSGWDTTTFGLRASAEDAYSSWKRFCNNAALEVTYNRPPYQPKLSELSMTPGGECTYGQPTEHYTKDVPVLKAVVWDPDHGDAGGNTEQLRAQFEVFWTAADGTTKSHTVTTDYKQSNPSSSRPDSGYEVFKYKVGTDIPGDGTGSFTIPQNSVIGWWVRGSDGEAWGPWSNAGDATRCEFIYDATKPIAPTVSSTQYPDDDAWHRGTGDYGSFSLHSPGTDVASYRYHITGEAWRTVRPPEPGRPATLTWMPPREGPYRLIVQAVDTAGNSQQTPNAYTFLVDKGRAPGGSWAMSDAAGSPQAAGGYGAPAATAGTGAKFAVDGPHGSLRTAVELDGTQDAYLTPNQHIVDTDKTFAVAAWVLLPDLPSSSMTVVSQDGAARSGFTLGYDGGSKRWSFLAPDSDFDPMTSWEVLGPKTVPGEWTHLVGVYDMNDGPAPGTMRMYVNGRLVTGDLQKRPTTWNATGSLQIGRSIEPTGYTGHLRGSVADVAVFDRVLTQPETQSLGGLPPAQRSYWTMDEASAGLVPEAAGGVGLNLYGGAGIHQADDTCDPLDPLCVPAAEPLWGDGHLALDGTDDYAGRAVGLLKAKASFTVAIRARLAAPNPTRDQTVLSLPGTSGTAALIRYHAATGRWQLVLTNGDSNPATPTEVVATGWLPSSEGNGDHLALSYDATFGLVQMYVNGAPAGAPVTWTNSWDLSQAGVQVGRKAAGGTGTECFSGAADEVRVFEGALDDPLVSAVSVLQSGESLGGAAT